MDADESDILPGLEKRIAAARDHLDQAERDLRDLLSETERSARSKKVIVGESLRAALAQLAETRRKLESALDAEAPPNSD